MFVHTVYVDAVTLKTEPEVTVQQQVQDEKALRKGTFIDRYF